MSNWQIACFPGIAKGHGQIEADYFNATLYNDHVRSTVSYLSHFHSSSAVEFVGCNLDQGYLCCGGTETARGTPGYSKIATRILVDSHLADLCVWAAAGGCDLLAAYGKFYIQVVHQLGQPWVHQRQRTKQGPTSPTTSSTWSSQVLAKRIPQQKKTYIWYSGWSRGCLPSKLTRQ